MKATGWVLLAGLLLTRAEAGSVLFDFDNANPYTPLPISLSVEGITAQFSGTGQGYSIQRANTLGFTPVGFSGNCIYPSSVYAADLRIAFSVLLTDFAILYAPEEYDCDSSARMRVTIYRDGTVVGTATTNAHAGTWPTATLRIAAAAGFNSAVVHYDAPPVTGGDWGPIFLADNLVVTPAARPSATAILLVNPTILPGGTFQCWPARIRPPRPTRGRCWGWRRRPRLANIKSPIRRRPTARRVIIGCVRLKMADRRGTEGRAASLELAWRSLGSSPQLLPFLLGCKNGIMGGGSAGLGSDEAGAQLLSQLVFVQVPADEHQIGLGGRGGMNIESGTGAAELKEISHGVGIKPDHAFSAEQAGRQPVVKPRLEPARG